jgi:AraC family transcriptional regulator
LGAVWSHAPIAAEVSALPQHAIVLHLSGSTLVEKWMNGRLVGHRARVGHISLVPARVTSGWVLSGHSRVAHLYVSPQQLAQAAAHTDTLAIGANCSAVLRDFFAVPDEVIAALMRLVLAQAQAGSLDVLAHDELLALLTRHLLRHHAAGAPLPTAVPTATLTAATLRRLFEHIEARLATELRLSELAALVHLSDDHFLRAFKNAVGQTPHRYVLARRIAHAQQLLAHTTTPVAAVAQAAGFKGASHFAAAFRQQQGTTPTAWRAQRRG